MSFKEILKLGEIYIEKYAYHISKLSKLPKLSGYIKSF